MKVSSHLKAELHILITMSSEPPLQLTTATAQPISFDIESFVYLHPSSFYSSTPLVPHNPLSPLLVFRGQSKTSKIVGSNFFSLTADQVGKNDPTFLEVNVTYKVLLSVPVTQTFGTYLSKYIYDIYFTKPTNIINPSLLVTDKATLGSRGRPSFTSGTITYDLQDDAYIMENSNRAILIARTTGETKFSASIGTQLTLNVNLPLRGYSAQNFINLLYIYTDNDGAQTIWIGDGNVSSTGGYPRFDTSIFERQKLYTPITLSKLAFASTYPRIEILPASSGPFTSQLRSMGTSVYSETPFPTLTFKVTNYESIDQAFIDLTAKPFLVTEEGKTLRLYNTTMEHGLSPGSKIQLLSGTNISKIYSDLYVTLEGPAVDPVLSGLSFYDPAKETCELTCRILKPVSDLTLETLQAFKNASYFVASQLDVEFPNHGLNEIRAFVTPLGQADLAIVHTKLSHSLMANMKVSISIWIDSSTVIHRQGEVIKKASLYSFFLRLTENFPSPGKVFYHGFTGSDTGINFYGMSSVNSNKIGTYGPIDFQKSNCKIINVIDKHRFRIGFPNVGTLPQLNFVTSFGGSEVRISSYTHGYKKVHENINRDRSPQLPVLIENNIEPYYYLCVRIPGYIGTNNPGIMNNNNIEFILAKIVLTEVNSQLFNTCVSDEHVFLPVLASKVFELDIFLRKPDGSIVDMGYLEFSFTLQIDEIQDYLEAEGIVQNTPRVNLNRSN